MVCEWTNGIIGRYSIEGRLMAFIWEMLSGFDDVIHIFSRLIGEIKVNVSRDGAFMSFL